VATPTRETRTEDGARGDDGGGGACAADLPRRGRSGDSARPGGVADGAVRLAESQPEGAAETTVVAQAAESPWVKLCENVSVADTNRALCVTTHERLDGATGRVLVSAGLSELQGDGTQTLMAQVPEGVLLPPGLRIAIYAKDDWKRLEQNEWVDERRARLVTLTYTLCHAGGCAAEMAATPSLLLDLKGGGGLVVSATAATSEVLSFRVPLSGFSEAYAGPPADNEKYTRIRRALMQQIEDRRRAAGSK
jgi:invasion protein IalB